MAAFLGVLLFPALAEGTFPGENGKLALDTFLGSSRIRTVNPDGGGLDQLTTGFSGGIYEDAAAAAWSPDGNRIAFASHVRETRFWRLEVMAADGTDRTTLLESGDSIGSPAWSPDGNRILFTIGPYQSLSMGTGLYVIGADGGPYAHVPIAGDVPDLISYPDWSPDGNEIVFEGESFYEYCDPYDPPECNRVLGPPGIYVVNPDGSGLRALTPTSDNRYPSWSPDGGQIAFGHGLRIRILNADTGTERDLGVQGYAPVWSPDGRQIAFATLFSSYEDPGGVHVMNVDGSGSTKVLDSGDGYGVPQYITASWQPIPNHAPDCSAVDGAPTLLWPANGKLRLVALRGATDQDGDPVTLEITAVTQDEPVRGARGAQHTSAGDEVRLRADRDPRGDGRVYRIAFGATDGKGGSCEGMATVSVPRHRRVGAVDSAPPSYDSFSR